MSKRFCAVLAAVFLLLLAGEGAMADQKGDYVVLLHGIGRTSAAMAKLEKSLTADGYQVLNIDYPSREKSLADLVETIHPQIKNAAADTSRKLHFVGYSMGGLLARAYVKKYPPENVGRIVLLGTPNKGSEVADLLEKTAAFNWFYGPAGKELTTAFNQESLFGKPDYDVGVIAGTRTVDPVSYFIIPGANDGKVSVESTKIDGMKDHLVLPVTHTFMPQNKTVIAQVKNFIKSGMFRR